MGKNHTPGPWIYIEDGEAGVYHIRKIGLDGLWVLSFLHNGEQWLDTQRANANRIVDCVNALEGVEDPAEWIAQANEFYAWVKAEKPGLCDAFFEKHYPLKNQLEKAIKALQDMTAFASNDFLPGYAERSPEYKAVYQNSVALIEEITGEPFSPWNSVTGSKHETDL